MKLIILDRDGVINFEPKNCIASPDEWTAIPGSLEAIAKLNAAGYTISVATNQAGIAHGLYDIPTLNAIHEKMNLEVYKYDARIDRVFYCPQSDLDGCACRKPKPGLLHQIASHYELSLSDVYCVGDSLRDYQAATAVGCKFVLVRTGYGKQTSHEISSDTPVYDDLAAFVNDLLE